MVHINIFERPTIGRILVRKVIWVLVGLAAPEIIIWRALEQWREARAILAAVAEVTSATTTLVPGEKRSWLARWWSSPPGSDDDFGMETAFFIGMGGFAIGPRGCSNHRFTVTSTGLVRLLQERVITPESLVGLKRDIADKGKADMMMRFLVCTQGLWMLLQFVARKADGYPITLIELHTIVHVACAAVIYGFWWNKPFDAAWSLSLDIDDRVAALLCYSFGPRSMSRIHVSRTAPGEPRPDLPVLTPGGDHPRMADVPGLVRYGAYPQRSQIMSMVGLNRSGRGVLGFHGQTLVNTEKGFFISCDASIALVSDPFSETRFYSLLAEAIRSSPVDRTVLGERLITVDDSDHPLAAAQSRPGLLCTEVSDLRPRGSLPSSDSGFADPMWVFSFLSLLYGGAHAAAWNTHFPTDLERLLWRVASVVVASPVLILGLWEVERYLVARISASRSAVVVWVRKAGRYCFPVNAQGSYDMSPTGTELVVMFLKLIFFQGVPLIVYIAARAFLFTESFISLRSLPAGAYDTPRWVKLWPHL